MRRIAMSVATIMTSVFFTGQTAVADDPRPVLDWERRTVPGAEIASLSENMFGEQIDPHLGGINFSVVDVSIPGNFNIPVEIRRTLQQGRKYHPTETVAFGDWELDTPRITFSYIGDAPRDTRCRSKYKDVFTKRYRAIPAGATMNVMRMEPQDYGAGFELRMNGGSQTILDKRYNSGSDGDYFPSSATHVTKNNWYFTCLTADDGTDGFLGYSPDGNKYYFDKVVTKRAISPFYETSDYRGNMTTVSLMVTKIQDRYGNYVNYEYGTASVFNEPPFPGQPAEHLRAIRGSDGRLITLDYHTQPVDYGFGIRIPDYPIFADNTQLVSTVTANGRKWRYDYEELDYSFKNWERDPANRDIELPTLSRVTLPDYRSWKYELDDMVAVAAPTDLCGRANTPFEIRATNPYGAKLKVKLRERYHRMSSKKHHSRYNECWSPMLTYQSNNLDIKDVAYRAKISVVEKELTINGQVSKWAYAYEQDKGSSDKSHRSQHNTTVIAGPDGKVEYEHYWPRLSGSNSEGDGQLAQMKIFNSSGTLLESEKFYWWREKGVGFSFVDRDYDGRSPHSRRANLAKTEKIRYYATGSDTYTTSITYNPSHGSSTYSFGYPIKTSLVTNVTSSNKVTETEYDHKTSPWVLGLPKRVKVNSRETSSYVYDSLGRPKSEKRYGAAYRSYTYRNETNNKGSLHYVRDALGRHMILEKWARGTPSQITYNDGSIVKQGVSSNGWLSSVTDQLGQKTSYLYDPMGRLAKITPPTGGQAWEPTVIKYFGRTGGGLDMVTTKGQAYSKTTHDSALRPIATVTKANDTGWESYTNTKYDKLGRVIFTSRPSTSPTETNGVNYKHDALGRMLEELETAAPYAKTKYAYSSNNSLTVTDPASKITKTWRYGWDGPGTDAIRAIYRYGGIAGTEKTFSYRNVYGELTRVRRVGAGGKSDLNQYYTYDSRSRLCAYSSPEADTTFYGYNNADELTSYSKGRVGISAPTPTPTPTPIPDPDPNPYPTPNPRDPFGPIPNLPITLGFPDWTKSTKPSPPFGTFPVASPTPVHLNSCATPAGDTLVTLKRDDVGRIKETNYADAGTPDITNIYDAKGRLKEVRRGGTKRVFAYNNLDLVTDDDVYLTSPRTWTLRLDYQYNANGHRKAVNHVSGRWYDYQTDSLGRTLGVVTRNRSDQSTLSIFSAATFHPDGSVKSMRYGNGLKPGNVTYNRQLDARQLTKRVTVGTSSYKAMDLGYTYSPRERISVVSDYVNTAQSRRFGYDGTGQLKTATNGPSNATGGTWGSGAFTYDIHGNITKKVMLRRILNMDYDAHNRMIRVDSTSPYEPTKHIGYDSRGNATAFGAMELVYDMSDQPVSVRHLPTGNVNYVYDGLMKRVYVDNAGTSQDMMNFFDQSGALAGIYRIGGNYTDHIRANGQLVATVERKYYTSNGKRYTRWTPTFRANDHLGGTQAGFSGTGIVSFQEYYTPFGEVENANSVNNDRPGFAGHIRDKATGLNYMQARYQDPFSGRFLTVDPLSFLNTGDPSQFNRYMYGNNDPINKVDPTGQDAIDVQFVDQPIAMGETRTVWGFVSGGHSGIIAISPTGVTRYREYGRYGGPAGAVRDDQMGGISNIVYGENNVPTKESLRNVLSDMLTIAEKNKSTQLEVTVDLAADDYKAMMSEIKRWDTDVKYSWMARKTCHDFCTAVRKEGGGGSFRTSRDVFKSDLTKDTLDQTVDRLHAKWADVLSDP